jgi:hypothetical protein
MLLEWRRAYSLQGPRRVSTARLETANIKALSMFHSFALSAYNTD